MNLQIQNLSFEITNRTLLRDISFTIQKNDMIAVMGLNGSGKTTLLKMLSAYHSSSIGTCILDDKDIKSYTRKELAQKVCYIPQDFPTDFPFTVKDFVLMGCYPWQKGLFHNKENFDFVEYNLNKLELLNYKDRLVSTLSGGEKQRVLMARALTQKSQMILLDEPFNHLDLKHKQVLMQLLQDIHSQGKTIVAVLHDLNVAKKYFQKVLLLKNGRLEFFGNVDEGLSDEKVHEVFEISTSPDPSLQRRGNKGVLSL